MTIGGLSTETTVFGIILVLLTLRDLISLSEPGYSAASAKSDVIDDIDEDISAYWIPQKNGPGSKISAAKVVGPTIKILYCSSSGYQSTYDQYAEFIQEKYPEIHVEGIAYPLNTLRRVAAQFFTVFKFVLMGTMLANQWRLFRLIGIPERIITWISDNKLYATLLSFFLVNLIETQIASTGAFEIYLDDVPVWSKLQTGRLPNPPEIVQIIDNHIKFGGKESFQLPT